jgi:hypothetical protein
VYSGGVNRFLHGVFLSLGVLACGGSDEPAATGAGGVAGGSDGGGGAGASGGGGEGGGAVCGEDPIDPPAGAVCVTEVVGAVIDESAAGVADLQVSVCGEIACNPGDSDGSGSFAVEVGYRILPTDYSVIAHARELGKASFYFALPADATGPRIDVGELLLLDMPTTGAELIAEQDQLGAPAQTLSDNGVSLDIPDGVFINLGFDDVLLGDEGHLFKALRVPTVEQARYVPASLGAVAAYAFYPFEAQFRLEADITQRAKVPLSFPNDAALPAGTEFEVLALGSYLYADWVTPAAFEVVAEAVVSFDGIRVEMLPGEGVEYLTWLALRPK